MTKIMKRQSYGFTLIEILIVIVLLGILAVAVLSAINPIEQIRKANDSGRKSDAAELLNGLERYFTSFGNYPWGTASLAITNASSTSAAGIDTLITNNEMKPQFSSRSTIRDGELCVSSTTGGLVSVCFAPESKNAQEGGLGSLMSAADNTGTPSANCGTYTYASGCGGTCFVCIPQ